jgi:hypothetical protein
MNMSIDKELDYESDSERDGGRFTAATATVVLRGAAAIALLDMTEAARRTGVRLTLDQLATALVMWANRLSDAAIEGWDLVNDGLRGTPEQTFAAFRKYLDQVETMTKAASAGEGKIDAEFDAPGDRTEGQADAERIEAEVKRRVDAKLADLVVVGRASPNVADHVESVLEHLAASGWDVDAAAPDHSRVFASPAANERRARERDATAQWAAIISSHPDAFVRRWAKEVLDLAYVAPEIYAQKLANILVHAKSAATAIDGDRDSQAAEYLSRLAGLGWDVSAIRKAQATPAAQGAAVAVASKRKRKR